MSENLFSTYKTASYNAKKKVKKSKNIKIWKNIKIMLVYEAKIKYNTYVRIKKEKVKESKNLTLI